MNIASFNRIKLMEFSFEKENLFVNKPIDLEKIIIPYSNFITKKKKLKNFLSPDQRFILRSEIHSILNKKRGKSNGKCSI
ncbi:MAG: hypothetical protein P8Y70_04050 [Candidatus Lokiarchaeota archaeon]